MSDPGDTGWIKTSANELNNLLQVISESGEFLEEHVRGNPGGEKYLQMLREATARAGLVTRELADRLSGAVPIPPETTPVIRSLPSPTVRSVSKSPAITIHNPAGTRELIMMVDDEEFVTAIATQVLTSEGYRVVTAKDGFQAMDFYQQLQTEIDLVILDFTMPVMDGSDVFAELKRINPKVAVVLSSGFAEQERLRAMLAQGLRGFIPKPYTVQKLLNQVRHTLDAAPRP